MKQILVTAVLLTLSLAAEAQPRTPPARPPAQPWIGMSIRPFRDQTETRMLHVERIVPDGPSARAGVRPGDMIVKINGKSLQHVDDLDVLTFIGGLRPGVPLRLDLIRNGTHQAVVVTVGTLPESAREGWNRALMNARRARLRAQSAP